MQLSGGPYSYNRFDAYEEKLGEGKEEDRKDAMPKGDVGHDVHKRAVAAYNKANPSKAVSEGAGASTPGEMKKKVDKAGKKSIKGGRYLVGYDEKEEENEEGETAGGEGGGAMGEGYKPLPVDKMMRQAHKAYRKEEDAVKRGDEKGATKQMKRRFGMEAPDMRKAALDNKKKKKDVSEAVYGGTPAEPKKEKKMLVTNVDKRGGTPAYANMKAGDKRYKAADHMKEGVVTEGEDKYQMGAHGAVDDTHRQGDGMAGNDNRKPADHAANNEMALKAKKKDPAREKRIQDTMKNTGVTRAQAESIVKEELNNEETTENVMENRMAMYSRALGVMGAHYSGPGFGVSALEEKKEEEKDEKKKSEDKKADKDYDGDGEVESSKEEYFGSKDKAIKKAMAKEEVGITKEAVVEYLVSEGYANNEVSAEILHQHISDEFLAKIEEQMGG